MEIRLIDSLEEFLGLRPHWEEAIAADPHATVFLSWPWLRGWFESTPHPWSIVAARDGEHWLGFFPISVRGASHSYRIDQVRELCMAGDPAADYTGFVCRPEQQSQVLQAFAEYAVSELNWDRLRFRDLRDPRIDAFAQHLPTRSMSVQHCTGVCCPHIPLPSTWEDYLRCQVKPESRRSIRKRLRDADQECRLTWVADQEAAAHIDHLIGLAARRWGEGVDGNLPRSRSLFSSCAAAGSAIIATLWHGESPIASQGMFIDRKHRALRVYLAGFDERHARLSPGRALDAMCIRQAIEQGFADYDFLRGDEPYKFQFGAVPRHNRNLVAVRRNVHTATRLAVSRMRQSLRI